MCVSRILAAPHHQTTRENLSELLRFPVCIDRVVVPPWLMHGCLQYGYLETFVAAVQT